MILSVSHGQPSPKPDLSFFALSQPDAAGSTVIATITDSATAIEIVSARSAKICPSTSFRNTTGRNTATVVIVEAISARTT